MAKKNGRIDIILTIWFALSWFIFSAIIVAHLNIKSSFTKTLWKRGDLTKIGNTTVEFGITSARCPQGESEVFVNGKRCISIGDEENDILKEIIDYELLEKEKELGENLSAMEFFFQQCDYLKERKINSSGFISASLKAYSNCSNLCPEKSPYSVVGLIQPSLTSPSWRQLHIKYSMLRPGGRYRPTACLSRHKLAIIIPYRDREDHLKTLMYNLHSFLQRQQLQYGIFVIEQVGGGIFNRAMLLNIGYKEALAAYDSDCFIFHDVDHLPENDENSYGCHSNPRQLAVAMSKKKYKPMYRNFFGGVSVLSRRHMEATNGYSNKYFGWGAEDDDMWKRMSAKNLKVLRNNVDVGRYTTIPHTREKGNRAKNSRYRVYSLKRSSFDSASARMKLLSQAVPRMDEDGLNNLTYTVMKRDNRKMFTWILVDIKGIET